MEKLAHYWDLMTGHMNYQRFIIIGRSRSGSNFLRGLLNSHSQIHVFGEIFQNKDQISWGMDGYAQDERSLNEFRTQPVNFLAKRVFHKFPGRIRAVGFKLFYYHARDEAWLPVWDYLNSLDGLKVIHIKRQNILQTHLSRKRALLTDRWFNLTGEKEQLKPFPLDYAECLKDFEETRRQELETADYFAHANHPILDVYYEDLSLNTQQRMAEVQDFLNVKREELAPETFKQSTQPLSQSIENYAELKGRFTGTPWEEFFIE